MNKCQWHLVRVMVIMLVGNALNTAMLSAGGLFGSVMRQRLNIEVRRKRLIQQKRNRRHAIHRRENMRRLKLDMRSIDF